MAKENEYLKCDACGKEWNVDYHHIGEGTFCQYCGYGMATHQDNIWCPERMVREIVRRIKGEPHLCDSCIRVGGMLEKA